MSLPETCIRRPVMTTLLMMSFVVFGIFGYINLPISALPNVDFPTISVSAQLPGANPETMASAVAAPLERAFATIPGITLMTSRSSNGSTYITIQFDLDRNIDGAALDVQSEITATLKKLPPTLPAPPSFRKVNPADAPVLILSLASPTLPLSTTNDYAEQIFMQQISQLPGVAQVNVFGAQRYAVRIDADTDKLAARGLTMTDVSNAVVAANSITPVGGLRGETRNVTLDAPGQLLHAEDFRPIVVAWRNGAPVRVGDVGNVIDSVENDQIGAWYGNQRAIQLAILRQSDANTVAVVDGIKEKLPLYQSQLPPSIQAYVLHDRSDSIRQSVNDVQFTLTLSISLVVLVIFLFLKSFAATLIPSLALPVSLIGTCAFMFLFGYSIDNISLLAITLAVGFVVDDAIVMLENIVRHIEEGQQPFEAALVGAREIGYTILSITLSLVAVFIPVLLMGGVVGRVFREFAVTISCSILVSGFVSLTLTPMLCARILSPIDHHARQNAFYRFIDLVIAGITNAYRTTLDLVLRWRLVMLGVTFVTFYLSVSLFISIPKGFFPIEDTGFISGSTEIAAGTGFPLFAKRQQDIASILTKDPAVDYITSSVGSGGSNQGSILVALKPKGHRDSMDVILARLRKEAAAVPGINSVFQAIQNLNLNGGRSSRAPYQYTLQATDLNSLYQKAPEMLTKLQQLPMLRDVNSDLQIRNPTIAVDVDHDKASALGLTTDQIRTALYNSYGTHQISTIFTQASDYEVILETSHAMQDDPSAIGRVVIRAQSGSGGNAGSSSTSGSGSGSSTVSSAPIVRLDEVATLRRVTEPLTVNRQSQQPSVTLSFNVAPGSSIGEAVEAITAAEREVHLPPTISTNFSGSAALFQDAQKGQVPLILAAVLTIYIVLGVLYESYIHPITILSGLPSAGLGALVALEIFHLDLSVIAIIGILLLIGIVKKNAIMMIDFALVRRRDGLDALTAIREAALVRFRPIFMTTLAAILGALPIAIGTGAGAELRQPLGIAIVGGLCVSQLLTLFITPVVYYYLDKVDSLLAGRSSRKAETNLPVPEVLPEAAE
ncbi:MAG TPA: efflux RND transporter permease subunit [Beijerinckiaceae bacterium]|nr:efflux RND transporter permease subunit [Beijerinckiaceae bacterium]